MDKKKISSMLTKWFGRNPTVREMVWYEIHHEPRKELHMSDYDKLHADKKAFKIELFKIKEWSVKAKRLIGPDIRVIDDDIDNILQKIDLILDNIAQGEQTEWRRKQIEYMKKWHDSRGMMPPKEVTRLIDEIYANK